MPASLVNSLVLVLVLTVFSLPVRAQDNYEIQVYPSDTVEPQHTMVELHSNFTVQGRKQVLNGLLPTQHAFHETLEITHGFTPWFEIGYYNFTSLRSGNGWDWVGTHIRPRVRVPEAWHWPVGVSISNEIGYQRRQFSVDTWTWEIRPIIDRKLGPWYLSFNPTVDRALRGENESVGFEFGLEYYGALGPIGSFDPIAEQQHQVLPAIDLNVSPNWEINFGVGIGTTRSTDHLLVKLILGYRFQKLSLRQKNKPAEPD